MSECRSRLRMCAPFSGGMDAIGACPVELSQLAGHLFVIREGEELNAANTLALAYASRGSVYQKSPFPFRKLDITGSYRTDSPEAVGLEGFDPMVWLVMTEDGAGQWRRLAIQPPMQ